MNENKYANSNNYGERIARLESNSNHVFTQLADIKNEIKEFRQEIKTMFNHLDNKIDTKIDKINSRLWTLFFWMIGGFASVLYVIAHADKWI